MPLIDDDLERAREAVANIAGYKFQCAAGPLNNCIEWWSLCDVLGLPDLNTPVPDALGHITRMARKLEILQLDHAQNPQLSADLAEMWMLFNTIAKSQGVDLKSCRRI